MVIRCVELIIFTILWKIKFSKIHKISIFCLRIIENGYLEASNWKNRHLRMFMIIKLDSRIVRPPRLILRMPTDLKTCWKANFESQSHLKIFYAHLNSHHHVCSETIFYDLDAIFMKILQNHEKIATSARLSDFKSIGAVSDHTTHFVGKLSTCTTPQKLIWSQSDA